MSRTIILVTERLVLREATADDAEFILDLLNQPSFKRFIGDRGAERWIRLASTSRRGSSKAMRTMDSAFTSPN